MSEELKPCPFCGGTDLGHQYGTEDREGTPCNVMCGDCGTSGPWEYIQKNQEALVDKAWNTRADDWIEVSERLPEINQLVIFDGGVGRYNGDEWTSEVGCSGRVIEWKVTHWKPLPAIPSPPKEKT